MVPRNAIIAYCLTIEKPTGVTSYQEQGQGSPTEGGNSPSYRLGIKVPNPNFSVNPKSPIYRVGIKIFEFRAVWVSIKVSEFRTKVGIN